MIRLATLLWVMGGSTLAGVFVMIVLMIPSLQSQAMKVIPLAALAGFVVGMPLALIAAKAITQRRAG